MKRTYISPKAHIFTIRTYNLLENRSLGLAEDIESWKEFNEEEFILQ